MGAGTAMAAANRRRSDNELSSGLSDRELLARFAERRDDEADAAFAALVRRYGPLVLSVCRRWTGSVHDAEDAFQVSFLVLARKAGAIRRPEQLRSWLHGVAIRTARRARHLADRRRRNELEEVAMGGRDPEASAVPLDVALVRSEEIEALHAEIAALPEVYRLPLLLCDLGGLTHAEAAARLRWPVGSLSVRLVRARKRLRERLARRGVCAALPLIASPTSGAQTTSTTIPPLLAADTVRLALAFRSGSAGALAGAAPSVAALAGDVLAFATPALAVVLATGAAFAAVVAVLVIRGTPAAERLERPASPTVAAGVIITAPAATEPPRRVAMPAPVRLDPPAAAIAPAERAEATPEPSGGALAAYRVLRRQTPPQAAAQVGLALWCESRGLVQERLLHLALAVQIDPSHAAARGLLGQVEIAGRWTAYDGAGVRDGTSSRHAAALDEYRVRRARMEPTADEHWRLALWCERHGLNAEARAHATAVTRLDPARDAAWKRLGYERWRGRWRTPEQIAALEKGAEAQKQADRLWRPRLEKWRRALELPEGDRRAAAEAQLARVSDPLAVPAIWTTFAEGSPECQAIAVRILGQVEGPAASRALTSLAVGAESAATRRAAVETLARRDPRESVGLLVSWLIDPVRYRADPIAGLGAPVTLLVQGDAFDLRRIYHAPAMADDPASAPQAWRNARTSLVQLATAMRTAEALRRDDVARIDVHNSAVAQVNERVATALRSLSGEDLGTDRKAWQGWWTDRQGYASVTPVPAFLTGKPMVDIVVTPPVVLTARAPVTGFNCFGAGTLVRTREGQRPIESLRIGDAVLSQDTTTGALSYLAVLAAHQNPPASTLRVRLEGSAEPIVTTGIHRFWKAGSGWVMARDLHRGDAVRTLARQVRVVAVEEGATERVYNLEVAPGHTFFAGPGGALVHDYSLVEPVARPFDRVPSEAGARQEDAAVDGGTTSAPAASAADTWESSNAMTM